MSRTAVYPGSFDPITLGHVDVITRASQVFDRIIMAVAKNPNKTSFLSHEQRVDFVRQAASKLPNVDVESFEGLTVHFAQTRGASVIIRGLRAVSDFEFEFKMSQMNRKLAPEIETIFMMAHLEYQFLASSTIREVAQLGGNTTGLVPDAVQTYLSTNYPSLNAVAN